MPTVHRSAIVACSILWSAGLFAVRGMTQELPSPAVVTGRAGVPCEVHLPAGYEPGQWLPLVVLWSEPSDVGPSLAHGGFVVVRLTISPDADALGRVLAEVRNAHRIDQGGMHAAIARDPRAAIASVLAERHEFQTVTVFGDAAGADLTALRRLRQRRVRSLATADPARLLDHLRELHREREEPGVAAEVARTLDSFHDAAAVGDGDRYFLILPDDAVFLGTDASERWTGAEFREFATPYFERASAWTYVPLQRHITLADDGRAAWFDEVLDNAGYGECRGTGVLVPREGRWVLRQYNLTVPVPNDLLGPVARRIRAFTDGAAPAVTTLLVAPIATGTVDPGRNDAHVGTSLLEVLRDVPLAGTYASDAVAARARLGAHELLPRGDGAAMIGKIRRDHAGGNVLLCVEPQQAAAMLATLGLAVPASDDALARLLVVTFGVDGPRVLALRLAGN